MRTTSHHLKPRDCYIHHVVGRLRVRSGLVRNNPSRAAEALTLLRSLPGVRSAVANELTGSLTVHYDSTRTTGATILGALQQAGWVGLEAAIPQPRTAVPAPWIRSEIGAQMAKHVAIYALEKVAERSVAALVAAVL